MKITKLSDLKIDKSFYILLIILAGAFAFRLFYLAEYIKSSIYPVMAQSDSYCYYTWAKDILSGDILGSKAFMKWPLYAYFLAFLFKVFGENIGTVYLIQFVLGVLNCWLIYLIAKKIFNEKTAIISAIFYLFTSQFIIYEGLLMYTALSIFLNLLFVLLLLKVDINSSRKKIFLLGMFLGVAVLTQANILIFGIFSFVWIIVKTKPVFKNFIFNILTFLFGLSLIMGLATLRNYKVEKDFDLIAGNLGINFYMGNNPKATGGFYCPDNISFNQEDILRDFRIVAEYETGKILKTSQISKFWFKKGSAFIFNEPVNYMKLLFKKLSYVLTGNFSGPDIENNFIREEIGLFKYTGWEIKFIVMFSLLGILFAKNEGNKTAILYLAVACLSASVILFFITLRYMMTVMPFMIIFAGFGFYTLIKIFLDKNYIKFFLIIIFMILFLIIIFMIKLKAKDKPGIDNYLSRAMRYEIRKDYQKSLEQLDLAQTVEPDNQRVLFRQGVIYFYLNDLIQAENRFKKILEINPLRVDAYYNLGLLYNKKVQYEQAKQVLQKGLSLDMEGLNIHYALAMAYKNSGENIQAEKELRYIKENLKPWRDKEIDMVKEQLTELGIKKAD
ncbi:MAG: glycosyltransferase family 39 protein [bacterium]|nr:glycosyltransferase family 39 protein [bacterium]